MKEQSYYQKFKPLIVSFILVFVLFIISSFHNNKTGFITYREEKLVTNPGSQEELLRFLNSSRYKIDVSIYVLTNKNVIKELNYLSNKGIQIRILLDKDVKDNYKTVRLLNKKIEVRFGNQSKITNFHAKYAIVDDRCAWVGSMNWNTWGLNTNREVAIITCNKNVVSRLVKVFSYDWNYAIRYHKH